VDRKIKIAFFELAWLVLVRGQLSVNGFRPLEIVLNLLSRLTSVQQQ